MEIVFQIPVRKSATVSSDQSVSTNKRKRTVDDDDRLAHMNTNRYMLRSKKVTLDSLPNSNMVETIDSNNISVLTAKSQRKTKRNRKLMKSQLNQVQRTEKPEVNVDQVPISPEVFKTCDKSSVETDKALDKLPMDSHIFANTNRYGLRSKKTDGFEDLQHLKSGILLYTRF